MHPLDAVIARIDEIVEHSCETNHGAGLFAALYGQVTRRVRAAVIAGDVFEDNDRMILFDQVFAQLYFDAYDAWMAGRLREGPWFLAFEAGRVPGVFLIQHVLLGINAHITQDLAIAAGEVALQESSERGVPVEESLEALYRDYGVINQILSELLEEVQGALGRHSVLLSVVDVLGGKADERLGMLTIEQSRERAWRFARAYVRMQESHRGAMCDVLRAEGTMLSRPVAGSHPLLWALRRLETTDLRRAIRTLNRVTRTTSSPSWSSVLVSGLRSRLGAA